MKYLFFFFSILVLTSCSALVRKQCGEVDWKQHAEKIGSNAQTLDRDELINKCIKAEFPLDQTTLQVSYQKGVNSYCSKENFFNLGLKGDKSLMAFCPTSSHAQLNVEYTLGTQKHCTKRGAYLRGEEGKMASDICPQKQIASYQKYFQKGRRQFLSSQIQNEELAISKLKNEINQINIQLHHLDTEDQRNLQQATNSNDRVSIFTQRDPKSVQSEPDRVLSNKEGLLEKIAQSERKIFDWKTEFNSLNMDEIPPDEKLD